MQRQVSEQAWEGVLKKNQLSAEVPAAGWATPSSESRYRALNENHATCCLCFLCECEHVCVHVCILDVFFSMCVHRCTQEKRLTSGVFFNPLNNASFILNQSPEPGSRI